MIQYLNVFFYDIYPYLCGTVFLVGSWLRYDYGQYTWRASSSQMLDKRGMVLWSNLFHIGILGIFFGHLFGMLTPHWVYSWFLPMSQKQLMAMILGGVCGVLTLVGGIGLLMRRLTNPRIRATLHDRGYFDPVHSADSVRAGADDHPLLRPASGRQRNAQAGGLGAGGGHLPRRRLGASGRCRMDLPRPPGARNDHLSDLPLHPAGSRLERAGGIFHPALPGGTLPALSAGGVYHSSLPVARTRPSRQVRVFIVPGSRFYAGWRLSPYPAYRVLSQAQTSQARASAAPPGKISGTVPVISPGGGCRLTRSTGSSHRLIPVGPRKRSARRARYQARFL
ncbi:respiratory nitrate reductase subunit gamma [Klebsiella pneumoniae]|nr:respiratory nitrate reductase subunit gamma [Klebsiella pneumoniae]